MNRSTSLLASVALLATLAACGDRVENTEMPQPAQANVEINRQGMEGAKDSDTAVGVENKGDKVGFVNSLGAKGDTSVMDPDVLIAEQVKAALASNPEFGASSKVDVHSEDGEVTLRGRAPDPAARERATEIARTIPNVRNVDNQLTLG
ncbi:BON domain-containing protein [Ramlibacter sp. USB13]|uniref:BON domain-containing protein n=1 Tax=Ramlibacter cellulosilyticus TaxID=2764187 RepID=A0A923MN80_9BURK|nr:BON domain-containing protein [Ramlibacter cellulosilyticus]MBC5781771.1 BON domain-containing protein [Ramlibacter cellulosilyticus]